MLLFIYLFICVYFSLYTFLCINLMFILLLFFFNIMMFLIIFSFIFVSFQYNDRKSGAGDSGNYNRRVEQKGFCSFLW